MIQSVKVKNLSLSKANVRRRNREAGLEELAESIAKNGLLQNLVVSPLKKAGTFTVKAGGRRLRAIQLLIEREALPADHEVPVLVLTGDEAASVGASLAENRQRAVMNPADDCEAFKTLIDEFGMTVEQVAIQQVVSVRFVEQRLALANLATPIFEALGAGEITLAVAQAYAATPDTDRQARVFEQMQRSYYGKEPDNIRRAILNGTVKGNDAKARFVGRDAYVAAGGRIEGDLFATEVDENWVDVDLIESLAVQKLEAAAAELAKTEGLAFVTPIAATHVPYDLERQLHEFHAPARPLTEDETARVERLSTENDALVDQLEQEFSEGSAEAQAAEARLTEIERELENIDDARHDLDPAVKAQVGTFVYIGGDGEPRVHTRLFSQKPVVDPHAPPKVAGGSDGSGADGGGDSSAGPKLSGTLIDELATQRRQILVAHLASDPAMALDLTIFLMAQNVVFANCHISDHSTLKSSASDFPIFSFRDEGSMASQTFDDQRQRLDTTWAGYQTMSERFDAFRALDEEVRGSWVAFAIARTLEPTLNVGEGYRCNGFHDHLGRLLGIQVEHWWRPTAENFFGRVKKDVMLDALEEIGGPILRGRYKDAKKGDLARTCASLCNGQGIVEAEIREKASAWLPDAMRFDAVEKPARLALHSTFSDGAEDDDDDLDPVTDEEMDGDDGTDLRDDEGGEELSQAA
ncbi:ParB/RepB/Spo0J family partition protein [Sphingomonas carotinifaciens]|uniref:ParB family protein n=1 Tax=Sphingomonas carotinifaciens TaxID=1166323 RepID=A0A1G7PX69_9SPHN|nr:ParB/RepB/Spo0J family partition protein [Sphingomonas carotinifaciens]MBB4087549.1 ParB family chromosome partitioning protein [Sphingomonas carotinifaciens]MWC45636.1 ParB/RepB/Spo0J family partition protein [Sphingomonas carotinifaciens]SDF90854.1 ParB family protein [Sphingomonas carotinifaciens]